jgi:hypothetical protein
VEGSDKINQEVDMDMEEEDTGELPARVSGGFVSNEEKHYVKAKRNAIAEAMWMDYQAILRRHH